VKGRALTLALIATLSLGSCQTSGELLGRTIRIENESLLSDPSASRSIGDLAQGDQRILLNFWGSWCVPCREEIPLFAEYDAREDGSIAAQIPVNAAPLTLLLDASGVVLDYRVGPFVSVEEIDAFVSGK